MARTIRLKDDAELFLSQKTDELNKLLVNSGQKAVTDMQLFHRVFMQAITTTVFDENGVMTFGVKARE